MFDEVTWMPAFAGMTVKRVQFLFPVACPLFPSLLLPAACYLHH